MRPPGSAAELEARRRRAAEHFQARKSLRTVSQLLGVSLSSVKRWKAAWQTGGVEALSAKPHPGGASKLTDRQRDELIEIVLAGPRASGYSTDLWTCARIAAVIRKRFDVQYHTGHLSRILHELGFSPQKPRQVAREQDAAAVQRWRTHDWPRIKKKPSAAAQPSRLSMKRAFVCSQ
ncbi:MAG: IS630 family transposase [Acidobacteria bacterium]|nr:IS630 family transposase [Acidobacteriota bacterium]